MLGGNSLVLLFVTFAAVSLTILPCNAFVPSLLSSHPRVTDSTTAVQFKIPFTDIKKDDEEKSPPQKKVKAKGKVKENDSAKSKIGFSGILQLITSGAGSPFLGDYEGIDEKTGNFMFSLEANNLYDKKGNSMQTQADYFEDGWVSDEDKKKEKERKKGGGWKLW